MSDERRLTGQALGDNDLSYACDLVVVTGEDGAEAYHLSPALPEGVALACFLSPEGEELYRPPSGDPAPKESAPKRRNRKG